MTEKTLAYLKSLTPESQNAVGGQTLPLDRLPFRVGRESRSGKSLFPQERREGRSEPNNDLYLHESTELVYVSREHFLIDEEDGEFWIVDRGSVLGTWVDGEKLGGDRRGGKKRLSPGDVIIVGSHRSGFIFQFAIASAET